VLTRGQKQIILVLRLGWFGCNQTDYRHGVSIESAVNPAFSSNHRKRTHRSGVWSIVRFGVFPPPWRKWMLRRPAQSSLASSAILTRSGCVLSLAPTIRLLFPLKNLLKPRTQGQGIMARRSVNTRLSLPAGWQRAHENRHSVRVGTGESVILSPRRQAHQRRGRALRVAGFVGALPHPTLKLGNQQ
jgi:hypothetical protein